VAVVRGGDGCGAVVGAGEGVMAGWVVGAAGFGGPGRVLGGPLSRWTRWGCARRDGNKVWCAKEGARVGFGNVVGRVNKRLGVEG